MTDLTQFIDILSYGILRKMTDLPQFIDTRKVLLRDVPRGGDFDSG